MKMQRFTRLPTRRQTDRSTNHNSMTAEMLAPRAKGRRVALVICALMAAVLAAPASLNGDAGEAEKVALQGHAKRYLRINEYLFHGTQKTTAVALQGADSNRHTV